MSELAWMHLMNKKCSRTAEWWHVIQSGPLSRTERNKSHPSSPRHKANKSPRLCFITDVRRHLRQMASVWFSYSRFLADRGRKSLLSYHLSSSSRERTSVCSTRDPPLVQFTERMLPVWSVYIWTVIGGITSFIFMWALVLKRTFLVREQKKKTSQEILKVSKSREQKRQESESWNSSVVYFYFISDELGLVVNHLESHCRVAMKHLDFMWHISCWSSKSRN